jgi:uncharacterized protein (TIGR03086 family)
MDVIELHDRALEATTSIVANVDASQFDMGTPCAEFDVRALLDHMIGGNYLFVAAATGEPPEPAPPTDDFVRGDALTPYRESADAVSKAWSDRSVLERAVHLPFGEVPGEVALGMHTVETIVHGWDLAQATGQPTDIDPELYAVAWQNAKDIDDSLRGPGRPFGPAMTAPAGATDTAQLMAWLGRRS